MDERLAVETARRFISELEKRGVKVVEAYLFGSWARGDWLVDSDVDVVVVSPDFRGVPWLKRLELLAKVEASLDLPLIDRRPSLHPRGGGGVVFGRVEGRQEVLEENLAIGISRRS